MLIVVPQIFIDSNNPPLGGLESLNRSKIDVKNACLPTTSFTAGLGASMINSDITVPCVLQNVQVTFGYRVFPYSNELSRSCQVCCQAFC